MTLVPLVRDSATFSAASRQIEQRMNSVSPSLNSFAWRSKVRGVEATVKLATAAPDGVKRSSGSPVRFPITVMTVSPAMPAPRLSWLSQDLAATALAALAALALAALAALAGSTRMTLVRSTTSLRPSWRSSSLAVSAVAVKSTTA